MWDWNETNKTFFKMFFSWKFSWCNVKRKINRWQWMRRRTSFSFGLFSIGRLTCFKIAKYFAWRHSFYKNIFFVLWTLKIKNRIILLQWHSFLFSIISSWQMKTQYVVFFIKLNSSNQNDIHYHIYVYIKKKSELVSTMHRWSLLI
jgi:hypothetical protein